MWMNLSTFNANRELTVLALCGTKWTFTTTTTTTTPAAAAAAEQDHCWPQDHKTLTWLSGIW